MISMGPASSDILGFYSLNACQLMDALEGGKMREAGSRSRKRGGETTITLHAHL